MASAAYFNRDSLTHLDGSRIFQNAGDRAAEEAVAAQLASAWGCEIHRFAGLSVLDWFATRQGRMVGVLELKARSHPIAQYPTVFLSVRKWLALQFGALGLGVPGIFVVRFADALKWIPVADVDASAVRLTGGIRRNRGASDIEPLIDVPIAALRALSSQESP
jgi:hypothetical protein